MEDAMQGMHWIQESLVQGAVAHQTAEGLSGVSASIAINRKTNEALRSIMRGGFWHGSRQYEVLTC